MSIFKKKPTKRELNALETKNKIFQTALTLFSKYGYNEVTVEDIARYVGCSKGTFYTYFPSKESVLLEQFRMLDAHYEQIFKNVKVTASATERVMTLIRGMCDYCVNVVGIDPLQVIYANQITSSKTIKILNDKNRPVYRIMRESVNHGKITGEFPSRIETDELVELLMRSSRGLIYDWCMYKNSFDLVAEGARYFSQILYLLNLAAKDEQAAE